MRSRSRPDGSSPKDSRPESPRLGSLNLPEGSFFSTEYLGGAEGMRFSMEEDPRWLGRPETLSEWRLGWWCGGGGRLREVERPFRVSRMPLKPRWHISRKVRSRQSELTTYMVIRKMVFSVGLQGKSEEALNS